MDLNVPIPFFESCDDTHCFQACLKMALAYLEPKTTYSFSQLDKISGHVPGLWTWQGTTLLYLAQRGFEVVNIENLDYSKFAALGRVYLQSIWDMQVYTVQDAHSNFDYEQQIAKRLIQNSAITLHNSDVTLNDAVQLLNDGYIVMVSINPHFLRGEEGYASHLIILTGYTNTQVLFHDPGPPGAAFQAASRKLFEQSMTKPVKQDETIIAIKRL